MIRELLRDVMPGAHSPSGLFAGPGLGETEDHDRITQVVTELKVPPARYGNELFPLLLEADGCGIASRTSVELPEQFAGPGLVGVEVAIPLTGKGETAGSRQ